MRKRRSSGSIKRQPERVYVVESGVCVKIGRSRNMRARLFSLRVNNPEPVKVVLMLDCPDAVVLEAQLHWEFRKSLRHGEWFALPTAFCLMRIRQMIDGDEINAQEYSTSKALRVQTRPAPVPKDAPEVVNRYCLWCNQGFFTNNPLKLFCDNPNHRVYYSKKRRQQLELWWWAYKQNTGYRDWGIREALESFDLERSAEIAEWNGFQFDADNRRWIIPVEDVQSLQELDSLLQTVGVQSAPRLALDQVQTSDYGTVLHALLSPLQQYTSPSATSPTNAAACDRVHSWLNSRSSQLRKDNPLPAWYRSKADAHAPPSPTTAHRHLPRVPSPDYFPPDCHA